MSILSTALKSKINLMNRILLLVVFSILTQATNSLYGQKVLGYPMEYIRPMNPYETSSISTFTSPNTQKDKDPNNGWWVVVDRDDVKAYTKPNSSSSVKNKLEFGRALYVKETQDGYAYLIDAIVDKTQVKQLKEEIGWVKMENLLLWNASLLNPRTKIHLKALLLNKFSDFKAIPCDKKEIVKVYTAPTGDNLRQTINIYRFYFVYKIQGSRYLLAETPQLGYGNAKDRILGWVNKDRIAEWNTRIALEPNFTEAGYNERKNDPDLQITGFSDQFLAKSYAETGTKGGAIFQRDPVSEKKVNLSKSDAKRFRGDYMRYPLLSVGEQKGAQKVLPYYKSAVCEEMLVKVKCVDGVTVAVKVPMNVAEDAKDYLEKFQAAGDNFNVFFMIEASADLKPYKEQIATLPDEIEGIIRGLNNKAKIKYGALTYKDITESTKVESLVKSTELSADKSVFERFIRNADFSNEKGNGDYPVQNYALSKSLEVAQFPRFQTNIIFVIGKRGDFSQDPLLRKQYTSSLANKDMSKLSSAINASNINLIGIQCVGGDSESDKAFSRNLRGIMLESAKKNFNLKFESEKIDPRAESAFKKVGYELTSPEMDDPDESTEPLLSLQNGKLKGSIFRIPVDGAAVSPEDFNQFATNITHKIAEANIQLYLELEKWKYGEIEPEKGFSPAMAQILVDLYKETKLSADVDWSEEKFELYSETYFAKQPSKAKQAPFSFVLFWPQGDLLDYYATLKKLVTNMGSSSASTRRSSLKDAYCSLLGQFTGGEYEKDCTEYTPEEIFQIIQGVQAEGINFELSKKTIGCILDERCTSDKEIEDMTNRFIKIEKQLKELVNTTGKNEFVFSRGGEFFFWIKVEDVY